MTPTNQSNSAKWPQLLSQSCNSHSLQDSGSHNIFKENQFYGWKLHLYPFGFGGNVKKGDEHCRVLALFPDDTCIYEYEYEYELVSILSMA